MPEGVPRFPPRFMKSCDCGERMALETCDGFAVRYDCLSCGEFLGELIMGGEP